jgi:hypothetical protein
MKSLILKREVVELEKKELVEKGAATKEQDQQNDLKQSSLDLVKQNQVESAHPVDEKMVEDAAAGIASLGSTSNIAVDDSTNTVLSDTVT